MRFAPTDGVRLTLASAFLVTVACVCTAALAKPMPELELRLDDTWVMDTQAGLTVSLFVSTGPGAHESVGGDIEVQLRPAGASENEPTTTLIGWAQPADAAVQVPAPVKFRVPRLPAGAYAVDIVASTEHGSAKAAAMVQLVTNHRVHLRTDRTVYRPGDRVRWWLNTTNRVDGHPSPGVFADVTLSDPKGRGLWSGRVETGPFGFADAEFPLADRLAFGTYVIEANADGHTYSRRFDVRDVRKPPYFVDLALRQDGATSVAVVQARTTQGMPLKGRVELSAEQDGQKLASTRGALRETGGFDWKLPAEVASRATTVRAKVTDGAERIERASVNAEAAAELGELQIALQPRRAPLYCGQPNEVVVIVTDHHGQPASADVALRSAALGVDEVARVDLARPFSVLPICASDAPVDVAVLVDGTADSNTHQLEVVATPTNQQRWIRARRPVIEPGEISGPEAEMVFDVRWPESTAPVTVTLHRGGAAIASATAEPVAASADPQPKDAPTTHIARVPVPVGAHGFLVVRAASVEWTVQSPRLSPTTAATSVLVLPESLNISVEGTREVRPGEEMALALEVRDEHGDPTPSVGLASWVVNEKVLRLGGDQPTLAERMKFDDREDADLIGAAFGRLVLAPDRGPNEALALEAVLAALPSEPDPLFASSTAAVRVETATRHSNELLPAVIEAWTSRPGPVVDVATGNFAVRLAELVELADVSESLTRTQWDEAWTWDVLQPLNGRAKPALIAAQVTEFRMAKVMESFGVLERGLHAALRERTRVSMGSVDGAHLVAEAYHSDAWGREFVWMRTPDDPLLTSVGPDGQFGSDDDIRWSPGLGRGLHGMGAGGGGFGSRHAGGSVYCRGAAMSPPPVSVRKRFEDTVLWAIGQRTDAGGRAQLEFQMSDEVTSWILEVEAVSGSGAVGHHRETLTTTLPYFAEIALPAALAKGDRYAVPVAVTNRTDQPASFVVKPHADGCLAASGPTELSLTVPAGDSAGHRLWMDASCTGAATLRLDVFDGSGAAIDRVERTVAVESVGRLQRRRVLAAGRGDQTMLATVVPRDVDPASVQGRVRVLRDATDSALDGLEDLLQEPHGCFEQTSSTTFPNALVAQLVRGKAEWREAAANARELVAKGYQRLLTFEVAGGGFSWFGEAPANRVLTAYGLLEFAEMAQVHPVDPELIERTRRWLLDQQEKTGQWRPDESWLHDWSAVQGEVSTTAYITWTLAESGYRGPELDRALRFLRKNRRSLADNAYLLALWAATEVALDGKPKTPAKLLARYAERSEEQLSFVPTAPTMMYGGGQAATAEVTAIASWTMDALGRGKEAQAARRWLGASRQPTSGWGTTQATVLSLMALARESSRPAWSGPPVALRLGDRPLGELELAEGGAIPSVGHASLPSRSEWRLVAEGEMPPGSWLDWRLSWRTSAVGEAQADGLKVSLAPAATSVEMGRTVAIAVDVVNEGSDVVPMPMAIVPVPPGFRANDSSLDRLRARAEVAKVEDRGSEVHVYGHLIEPGQTWALALEWLAQTPCDVLQRSARAYAYYNPEVQGLSGTTRLSVVAGTTTAQGPLNHRIDGSGAGLDRGSSGAEAPQ